MEINVNVPITLKAETRGDFGTAVAKRLRRAGRLPVVLYGHGADTITLSVGNAEFNDILRGGSRTFLLSHGGAEEQVMLKDIQYNLMGDRIIHVDLTRLKAGERVTVSVRIELVGVAKGTKGEGVLEQPLKELEVKCLPSAIPQSLTVNVTELDIDGVVRISDMEMPEGVKPVTDTETIVTQIVVPVEEEEAEPDAGFDMPKVIGEKKEETEE
jgi:large subunit ribosomal protein L25